MNNPETLATLDTQVTGRWQRKQSTQQRKLKDEKHEPHQKLGDEHRC